MPGLKIKQLGGQIKRSVWTFPIFLLVLLGVLTALGISGSSVGTYYQKFYGSQASDPNLIYGKPRAIRSDEWLVSSQRIISQSHNNFGSNGQDVGGVHQLSLKTDIPTKDWSTLFRPQNWGFLSMPLNQGFAFKWWLPMFLMIAACYFFILRLLPGQKLLAVLLGVAVGLSPFELWWYQTGAFFVIAFGFMAILLGMRIIDDAPVSFIKNKRLARWSTVAALGYVLACFGLVFYPPFQIPVAIGAVAVVVGYLIQKLSESGWRWRRFIRPVILLAAAGVLSGVVGFGFIQTHKTSFDALGQTVYPGHRTVEGGDLKLLNVFNSFVMPLEQSDKRGGNFITNQSESSNFILLLPFLVLPGIYLMLRQWRSERKIDWPFLAVQAVALLLFIRVFTPYGAPLFRLMLLHRVPNKRLIIGIGFIGILQMVYMLKKIREAKIPLFKRWSWATLYGFGCFVILWAIGIYITHHYPLFLHNIWLAGALAAGFAAMITLLLADLRLLFAGLFLAFTLASTFRIMPLYRNLNVLTNTPVIQAMDKVSGPNDAWVVVGADAGQYENFGFVAGRPSISGTQVYPDLKFWSQLGTQYNNVYDRQGHAFYVDDPTQTAPIELIQTDAFKVRFDCSSFITKNARYALSVHPLTTTSACTNLVDTIRYPAVTFYLYKIQQP